MRNAAADYCNQEGKRKAPAINCVLESGEF